MKFWRERGGQRLISQIGVRYRSGKTSGRKIVSAREAGVTARASCESITGGQQGSTHAMAKKKSANDATGRKVRVKAEVASPEFPEILLAGWSGTVVEVTGKPPAEKYVIEWDAATIAAMPADYITKCEAQQLYHLMACLDADSVEAV
jgi:hypothetical protein